MENSELIKIIARGEETPVNRFTFSDIDLAYFREFFQKEYGEEIDDQNITLPKILENMNLANESNLNIAGALLFAKRPQLQLPTFIVKAIAYPGTEVDVENYQDSRDITGKIADMFHQTVSFLIANIPHVQGDRSINSVGEPSIPRITFEEIVANALIHRDYFLSAPIRIFMFRDRIEIISPGHLPNNLTIENIKAGNSNIRNPILASFASKLLPYRGLGNGIIRAIEAYPNIEFVDDRDGNLFKVKINR